MTAIPLSDRHKPRGHKKDVTAHPPTPIRLSVVAIRRTVKCDHLVDPKDLANYDGMHREYRMGSTLKQTPISGAPAAPGQSHCAAILRAQSSSRPRRFSRLDFSRFRTCGHL